MNAPASNVGELLIARHGLAHCNIRGIVGGPRGCTGLTDTGRDQARALGRRLAHDHARQPIQVIITSPLLRARETAALICDQLDDSPQPLVDPDLAEQQHGTADGRPWSEVVREFGAPPVLHPDRPLASGGETWHQFITRTRNALRRILTDHDQQRILIIAHGETLHAALAFFFPLDNAHQTATVEAYHASLTVWRRIPLSWTNPAAGTRWSLAMHNDIQHLH